MHNRADGIYCLKNDILHILYMHINVIFHYLRRKSLFGIEANIFERLNEYLKKFGLLNRRTFGLQDFHYLKYF